MQLALALLTLLSLSGATINGTLKGVVSCPQGGRLADTCVTARNSVTGAITSTVTDVNGEYQLSLPGGGYSISVVKIGLKPQQTQGFNMEAKASTSLNFSLDCTPVIVTKSAVTLMTRASPECISREPLTSLPVPDSDAPAMGSHLNLDSLEVEVLRKRLDLNATQTAKILLILQRKQAQLVGIDGDRNLTPPLREKRFATAAREADGQIRKVLNRKQRRLRDHLETSSTKRS